MIKKSARTVRLAEGAASAADVAETTEAGLAA